MGASKNSEFARMQGAKKILVPANLKGYPTLKLCFAAPYMFDM
jgi:hypothetical protein